VGKFLESLTSTVTTKQTLQEIEDRERDPGG